MVTWGRRLYKIQNVARKRRKIEAGGQGEGEGGSRWGINWERGQVGEMIRERRESGGGGGRS